MQDPLDDMPRLWWLGSKSTYRDISASETLGGFVIFATFAIIATALGWLLDEVLSVTFHGVRVFWAELPGGIAVVALSAYVAPLVCRAIFSNLIGKAEADYRNSLIGARRRRQWEGHSAPGADDA